MKKRIIAILLSVAIIVPSFGVGSKAASTTLVPSIVGTATVATVSGAAVYAGALATAFNVINGALDFAAALGAELRGQLIDEIMLSCGYGDVGSKAILDRYCNSINAMFTDVNAFFGYVGQGFGLSYFQCQELVTSLSSYGLAPFHVTDIEEAGESRWVIVNDDETIIVADRLGRYPYALNVTDKFVPTSQLSGNVNPAGEDLLASKFSYLVTHGMSGGVSYMTYRHKGADYTVLGYTDEHTGTLYLYADEDGNFYGRFKEPLASEKPRDPVEVIVPDGDAIIIEDGADMEINIEDGIYYMPDGTLAFIENLIYNPDNKSYQISATNSFNTTNNTYYEYNTTNIYFIEYTSVTYIGSTGEYTEEYKYYYELPDGRSSADLTADELEALNTYIDVLPYIRSADDTSIRALYHFDGDTLDSSYWSHIGNFGWDKGASITYLEANAFNGCLYLDETEHQFHIQLPSNIGSKDFTMQFRYYQSYTAAPQNDSYVAFGDTVLARFNGSALLDPAGNSLRAISIGNWQEICFQRIDGTLSIFVNGVPVSTTSLSGAYGDSVVFSFGSSQQTYKYFDEFRFVNKAVYPETGYTPSSVPFDTNLALVLPDSSIPVADEYWSFESSKENLLFQYGLADWWGGAALESDYLISGAYSSYSYSNAWPNWFYATDITTPVVIDGVNFTTVAGAPLNTAAGIGAVSSPTWENVRVSQSVRLPSGGIFTLLSGAYGTSSNPSQTKVGLYSPGTSYTFSIVDSDGVVYSLPFTIPSFTAITPGRSSVVASMKVGQYSVNVLSCGFGSVNALGQFVFLQITAPFDTNTDEFIYWELVEGLGTDLTATWNTDVVVMQKPNLDTPSLAVRTDQTITGYQIGGVRPSLPQKGLVWALVESSRITSLQIYNGQAWVEVDGRIWTGQRWVPYYAYDVLLLKDMFDVVGSNPDKEYIYTESGFWTWLQGAWGQMMTKLEQIRVAITDGTGGGSGGDSSALPDVPPTTPDGDDGWSFVDLVVVLIGGTWVVVTRSVELVTDSLDGLKDSVSNIGGLFAALDSDSDSGLFYIPLE